MCLGLLGLLVSCGSLRVTLAVGSGRLAFQPMDPRFQGCHPVGLGVGLVQLHDQGGIVSIEPVHPGVQPHQPVALVPQHGQQLLSMKKCDWKSYARNRK